MFSSDNEILCVVIMRTQAFSSDVEILNVVILRNKGFLVTMKN